MSSRSFSEIIFLEGSKALETGHRICPYKRSSPQARLWWKGWRFARSLRLREEVQGNELVTTTSPVSTMRLNGDELDRMDYEV